MFDRSVRQSAWHSDGIIVSVRGACAYADGTAVSVPVPLSPPSARQQQQQQQQQQLAGQADTRWPAGLLTSAAAELRLPASFLFPSDGSWKIPFWQQLVSFCCCCLAFISLPRHSSWHCLQFSSIRFPTACRYLNKLPTNCAHTHSQSPFGGIPFPRPSKRGLVCVFTPCQMLRRSTHPSILVHPHRNGLAN